MYKNFLKVTGEKKYLDAQNHEHIIQSGEFADTEKTSITQKMMVLMLEKKKRSLLEMGQSLQRQLQWCSSCSYNQLSEVSIILA